MLCRQIGGGGICAGAIRSRQNSNMIIVQLYHAAVNQSWLVVQNRSGYALVAAYNVRNDDQHGIKGIQKRTNGDYTVMFEQNPGGELDLWLVWAKIGTTF